MWQHRDAIIDALIEYVNALYPIVNSAQFAALKPDKVREDELFMHTYFTQRTTHGREAISDKLKAIEDEEIESEMDFAGYEMFIVTNSKYSVC